MRTLRFHSCDWCGFSWQGDPWPVKCPRPGCPALVHWIASFEHRWQRDDHRVTHPPEQQNTPAPDAAA